MQVQLIVNQARARVLPSPLLGTVLPAVLGLLNQDPRPPVPELPDQFVEEHLEKSAESLAPVPDAFLQGMVLALEMDVRDSCAVLPLKPQLPSKLPDIQPKTDLDYDGLVVSASVIHASLASSVLEESLTLSVEAASVVAPGGYEILKPITSVVELSYRTSWHEPGTGPKVPLRSVIMRLPMASLSVSLAVMRTVKKSATTLARGFDSEQAAVEPTETMQEEDKFRRVRRLFLDNDVDNSGELGRTEVLRLVERLCVDNYALTQQELMLAFDEIWTAMDSSNDGQVSFEEFCDTLGGENRSFRGISNFGSLSPPAGELSSKGFMEGHEEEDEATFKERLWTLLSEDIPQQIPGGGTNSSPLTLQWKLLRCLRNYSQAREFWESIVRPSVAPQANWEIESDRPVPSARDLIFAALWDSGQIQQITEDTGKGEISSSIRSHRSGLKLRISSEGFRLNLEDPLSQLQGQHRLSLGAVTENRESDSKAFDLEITYWHMQGQRHLAFEDELKATVAVRGFFGSCMNPAHQEPEYIMESFGFIFRVESGANMKALTCRFIADTHFVMNVTSSLLLGVKPIIGTLMPPEEIDTLNDNTSLSAGGTAPLAHLLHGLKQLKLEKLEEFKLLIQSPDEAGVGTKVPGDKKLKISTRPPRGLDRRGSEKFKWVIPFDVESPTNLTRIMLSNDWNIIEIHQTSALCYELYLEAKQKGLSDPPAPAELHVWSVDASAEPMGQREVNEESDSAASAVQEDAPERRSCQSSRKLQVLNRCGVPTEVWFEKRGSKDRINRQVLDKDPEPKTQEVPLDCTLCVGLEEVQVYKSGKARPDLTSFGRCGAPLYALQGIMSSARADKMDHQCCLTASLSIGPQGQAQLELLPPLELQNATQLPLRLHLYPPYGNESVVTQMGIAGLTRSSAAWATLNAEPREEVVPPGGTFQVPLHMLHSGADNGRFGQHFWQVMAEAIPPQQNHCSLAFAFPLGGSILRSGPKELEFRRSLGLALETTSITGSDPQKTTLERFSLLLLPGLRVVNSLPMKISVTLQRDHISRDETCEMEPGGICDFGRSPFGCQLLLSVDGEEPQSLEMPAEALACRTKFKELKVDQLQLSSSLVCSLQCSWQAGTAPEIVITGKCLLFNKTGLLLQVSDRQLLLEAPLEPGNAAVLGTEAEVHIGLGPSQVREHQPSTLPEKSEDLELRGFADVQDKEKLFCWRAYTVKLSQGTLFLNRKRIAEGKTDLSDLQADPIPAAWR
eukprot:symbB.v1.2.005359.t1/scaffold301.1/size235092/11